MYDTPRAQPSTAGHLLIKEKDILALLMPLPRVQECFLTIRDREKSKLLPGTIIPEWPHHIATYHAAVLQFLTERNARVNTHQLQCLEISGTKNKDLASYLHRGWSLFDSKNHITLFGGINVPTDQNRSFLDAVWSLFGKTWKFILDNDVGAPWRDHMIRQTLLKRGDFEIRFYLFHTAVVEYFTTVILARTMLSSEQIVDMPFAEQEYAVWCTLTAATLLLFKGKGLAQEEILEHTLMKTFDAVPAIKADIESEVKNFLKTEGGMRYVLGQMEPWAVTEKYDAAYRGHAQRVVQVHQALGLPLI